MLLSDCDPESLRRCLWLLRSLCRLWDGDGERDEDLDELEDGLLWEKMFR